MVARKFVEAGEIEQGPSARHRDGLGSARRAPGLREDRRGRDRAEEPGIRDRQSKLLTQANALVDTWLGHFSLGRAYLAAEQFAQADSEFERCLKRRGEALQVILGDEPTYAYVPSVYYYQGRVREGMKEKDPTDSYRRYLEVPRQLHRGSERARDPQARRPHPRLKRRAHGLVKLRLSLPSLMFGPLELEPFNRFRA